MSKIELTNEQEIEDFKEFCQHKEQIRQWHKNWQEVIDFGSKVSFGSFQVTVKDGLPVRINKVMQQLIIGAIK